MGQLPNIDQCSASLPSMNFDTQPPPWVGHTYPPTTLFGGKLEESGILPASFSFSLSRCTKPVYEHTIFSEASLLLTVTGFCDPTHGFCDPTHVLHGFCDPSLLMLHKQYTTKYCFQILEENENGTGWIPDPSDFSEGCGHTRLTTPQVR